MITSPIDVRVRFGDFVTYQGKKGVVVGFDDSKERNIEIYLKGEGYNYGVWCNIKDLELQVNHV
jgi:hypothetical protein